MTKNTKRLSFCGVLTALSVVLLYLASSLPSGRLAVCALTAVLPAVAMILYGTRWAVLVYAATSIISLIVMPSKILALIYALALGQYTVTKSLIERLDSAFLRWLIKVIIFNACFLALCLLYELVLGLTLPYEQWLMFIIGTPVFIIYDIGLTRLINGYLLKLVEKLR